MRTPNSTDLENQRDKLVSVILKAVNLLNPVHRKSTSASTAFTTMLALVAGLASTGSGLFPQASITSLAVSSILFGAIIFFFALRERKRDADVRDADVDIEILVKDLEAKILILKELEKNLQKEKNPTISPETIKDIPKGDV